MGLQKSGTTATKTPRATTVKKTEYAKATAWLNQQVVRSDKSTFKLKRGVAVVEGECPVLDALEKSERAYRAKCNDEGIEYVPRTIHLQGTIQLVDPTPELPDLFV